MSFLKKLMFFVGLKLIQEMKIKLFQYVKLGESAVISYFSLVQKRVSFVNLVIKYNCMKNSNPNLLIIRCGTWNYWITCCRGP